jgi:hypothetical protein
MQTRHRLHRLSKAVISGVSVPDWMETPTVNYNSAMTAVESVRSQPNRGRSSTSKSWSEWTHKDLPSWL